MNRDLFDEELEMPDRTAGQRLNRLVGLDPIKAALATNATVLLDPSALRTWSAATHSSILPIVERFAERTPLFVLAGDVGTGKSTLAETFAQQVAIDRRINISVLRLSLRSRGTGAVGEMTRLLGEAFDEVIARGRNLRNGDAIVVIIDEADAIAQSREFGQMHHEDRAGVNALIRGIDTVAAERRPILVLMCTNRLSALDPAVRRRAAAEFEFTRPNDAQRLEVLRDGLVDCGLSPTELDKLVDLTGDTGRGYVYTYSDLVNRVIPAAVLKAFPDRPITIDIVADAIATNPPTPPFQNE